MAESAAGTVQGGVWSDEMKSRRRPSPSARAWAMNGIISRIGGTCEERSASASLAENSQRLKRSTPLRVCTSIILGRSSRLSR